MYNNLKDPKHFQYALYNDDYYFSLSTYSSYTEILKYYNFEIVTEFYNKIITEYDFKTLIKLGLDFPKKLNFFDHIILPTFYKTNISFRDHVFNCIETYFKEQKK